MTTVAPWPVVALGDVAETSLGKMLNAGRPKGAVETPYLRNVNVQWGRIDTADVATVPLSDAERCRFSLQPGDLLVCEGGAIGRAAIWHGPEIAYQKALHRVRSRGDLDLRWLRYLLEHYDSTGVLAARATGSTIKHLPQVQLRQLPVPLPSLAEQRRIVDLLEDHLSRLDAARDYLRASRRRLASLEAAILNGCVAGDRVALGELALHAGYGTSTKCVEGGPGAPVVRIPNLSAGRIDLASEKRAADPGADLRALMLEPDDLLIVRTNGSRALIGRTAVVQPGITAAFASYLIRYKLDQRRVRAPWASLMLGSPAVRTTLEALAASSAGQYNLGLAKLNCVQIPVPALAEQDQALAQVEQQHGATIRLAEHVQRAKAQGDGLRSALLAAAFLGRL